MLPVRHVLAIVGGLITVTCIWHIRVASFGMNTQVIRRQIESPELLSQTGPSESTQYPYGARSLSLDGTASFEVSDMDLDASALSMTAWVLPQAGASSSGSMILVSNKPSGCQGPSKGFSWYLRCSGKSSCSINIEYGTANGCQRVESSTEVAMDSWTHVGAVFGSPLNLRSKSDSDRKIALYINGKEVAVNNRADERQTVESGRMYIGSSADGKQPFRGQMDEIRIWQRSLSHESIRSDSSLTQPEVRGLVLHLSMEKGSEERGKLQPLKQKSETVNIDAAESKPKSDDKSAQPSGQVAVQPTTAVQFTPDASFFAKLSKQRPKGPVHGFDQIMSELSKSPFHGPAVVSADERLNSDSLALMRREKIKSAFLHAWNSYKKHAWGHDELKPMAETYSDNFRLGVTIVDSLSALWVMGFKDQFEEARNWVKNDLTFDKDTTVSVFETNIRILGGLVSAYDLSGDSMFLDKAKEFADALLPAFNTPHGIPHGVTNLKTGQGEYYKWTGGKAILADFGSLHLEFKSLAHSTRSKKYYDLMERITDVINRSGANLPSSFFHGESGSPAGGPVTFGAYADSFYEYLPKQWVLTGKTEDRYKTMWKKALEGMFNQLASRSHRDGLYFVPDNSKRTMEHLACFLPGTLAFAAHHKVADGIDPELLMTFAKEFAYTCYQLYKRSPSGLAADSVSFNDNPTAEDFHPQGRQFHLRPETVESLFYLSYFTGDPIYREWGWEIFEAIEKHCRKSSGYAHVSDVTRNPPPLEDRMESFFLSEVLQYLYLLFSPDKPLSLDNWVFNTEAHALKTFTPKWE
eukprot:GILJ01007609.1.p1 GENE.GILJ01007609.1~~GILJ01007609.1.p1  ORF type:complete len:807 (-),score=131.86 GILJ01007609.1:274-2694(-)